MISHAQLAFYKWLFPTHRCFADALVSLNCQFDMAESLEKRVLIEGLLRTNFPVGVVFIVN